MNTLEFPQPSRMYGYVRARQLEGTYNGDPTIGTWVTSAMRIARGWGRPIEGEWPYDGRREAWPPKEPVNIDAAAKAHRVSVYQRVRSVDDCRRALAQKELPTAAFEIVRADWSNAKAGVIPMPAASAKLDASHSVALVGYDDRRGCFTFRNSWGASWGDNGYGYLPYDYIEKYQLEAWIIPNWRPNRPPQATSGIVEECWGIAERITGVPLHGFEYFDVTNDECIAWAFVVERDGFADIEELFVRPAYRRQGYGGRLADIIRASPRIAKVPLRFWGSHADTASSAAVTKTLARLGLIARPSGVRWAAFVGT